MAIYQSGVIFKDVNTQDPNCWTLDEYIKRGGYQALHKIISEKTPQDDIINELKTSNLATPTRASRAPSKTATSSCSTRMR